MAEVFKRNLCHVYCGQGENRKTGIYLGGHCNYAQRSSAGYIRCTTVGCPSGCDKKPLQLAPVGCIFTAAKFKEHASRGQSKSATEIRTLVNGVDDPMENWQDAKKVEVIQSGKVRIGSHISVLWPDGIYYAGTVADIREDGLYGILYDDGDKEEVLNLPQEMYQLLDEVQEQVAGMEDDQRSFQHTAISNPTSSAIQLLEGMRGMHVRESPPGPHGVPPEPLQPQQQQQQREERMAANIEIPQQGPPEQSQPPRQAGHEQMLSPALAPAPAVQHPGMPAGQHGFAQHTDQERPWSERKRKFLNDMDHLLETELALSQSANVQLQAQLAEKERDVQAAISRHAAEVQTLRAQLEEAAAAVAQVQQLQMQRDTAVQGETAAREELRQQQEAAQKSTREIQRLQNQLSISEGKLSTAQIENERERNTLQKKLQEEERKRKEAEQHGARLHIELNDANRRLKVIHDAAGGSTPPAARSFVQSHSVHQG